MFGGCLCAHPYNLQGAVVSAAMAAVLMVAGSSGMELAIILGLFGFALFLGDFGKGGAKGPAPRRKVAPPLCQQPGAEARGGREGAAQEARSGPAAPRGAPSWDNAGDRQWYTQRIIEESRKHRWPIALRLLNEMQHAGHKPEPIVYNCMIGDCKKGSRLERAHALFERMESEGVKANVITYTALMSVAARREDADEALRLFGLMRERQVSPNNVTYNTLIQACSKAKQPERALEVLQEARRENGYAPEVKTQTSRELYAALQDAGALPAGVSFASVADAVVEAGSPEKALELVRRMQAGDAAADGLDRHEERLREMFAVILEDLTRHDKLTMLRCRSLAGAARAGARPAAAPPMPPRPAAAEEPPPGEGARKSVFGKLLQDYRDDKEGAQAPPQARPSSGAEKRAEGTSVTSMTLISAFEKSRSLAEARRLLKTMRDTGCHPNVITYNAVLGICDRHSLAEEALQLYQEMLQDSLSPDHASYSSLISASAKGGNPMEGVGFLHAMQQSARKTSPSLHTYNALMDSCVRGQLATKVVELFGSMQLHQLTPDASSYTSVIGAYAQSRNWHMAVSMLTTMQEQGHAPGAAAYADAIRACIRSGKDGIARELMKAMQVQSVSPTTAVYTALLSGPHPASPQPQEASARAHRDLEVWQEMQSARVVPDAAAFAAVLASCEKAGRAEKATELFAAMAARRLDPTAEHHVHMFGALLRADRRGAALEFFETMPGPDDGPAVEISVYNQAIATYRAVGQHEKAFGVMKLIREHQLSPNVSTYAELISTCQLTGDGDKAVELIRELHSQGLKADVARWNAVIDILLSSGRLGEAVDLLAEMRSHKVHANTKTFSTLIGACERTGDAAAATRCFEIMCEHRAASPALMSNAVDVVRKSGMSEKEPPPRAAR